MASDDLKHFLQQRTGVPEARWKRLSKKTGTNGASVRLFEDRDTGRRVLTQELGGALSILEDSATPVPAATPSVPSHAPAGPSAAHGGDRRFAIVLCEDPSFDDAQDELLENDPSFDLSYRWMTTLRLVDDARTADPAVLIELRAALPGYRLTAPGEDGDGFTFEDLIFVIKQDLATGLCTCEGDRLDVVRRLEAHGWTFDPGMAETYAFRNGVPDELVGPIVPWRPGMPLPTPQSEGPVWRAHAHELEALLAGDARDADLQRLLATLGLLDEDGSLPNGLVTVRPAGRLLVLNPMGAWPMRADQAAGTSSSNPEAARFSFAFGENPDLPQGDWQHEWLEIYDSEDDSDDHVEGALDEAGIRLPSGLSEVVEGTFDYRLGDPCWTREDLFPLLLATGMTWDRERCVLAASGFDPDQKQGDTPWWRRT